MIEDEEYIPPQYEARRIGISGSRWGIVDTYTGLYLQSARGIRWTASRGASIRIAAELSSIPAPIERKNGKESK